ncbi:MAG: hypothetical protein L6R42_000082 [Xanthoria sp. 1 TBL-2021]|nr:MAG: hypothetical protein L6R42_000082 [Xanthoria sp. 1 TBL-2021]
MGGTSTNSPQLDIDPVAAGGGSRLFFRNGPVVVGPESAGAHPGLACYRKGGLWVVTDANLFLGPLLPDFFPKIVGKSEDQVLDKEASEKLFYDLTKHINNKNAQQSKEKQPTVDEVAYGFVKTVNKTMTRPIRSLNEAKRHYTSQYRLATFGGAGGQHAILSAYGMAVADVVDESQIPDSKVWSHNGNVVKDLRKTMNDLRVKSTAKLKDQAFADESIIFEEYLNMRYRALMAFGKAFVKQHEQEFGFTLPDRGIIVNDVRARGIGKSYEGPDKTVDQQLKEIRPKDVGRGHVPVPPMSTLKVAGRGLLYTSLKTLGWATAYEDQPFWQMARERSLLMTGKEQSQATEVNAKEVDPIMLSIFVHRFTAIADRIGRTL